MALLRCCLMLPSVSSLWSYSDGLPSSYSHSSPFPASSYAASLLYSLPSFSALELMVLLRALVPVLRPAVSPPLLLPAVLLVLSALRLPAP